MKETKIVKNVDFNHSLVPFYPKKFTEVRLFFAMA